MIKVVLIPFPEKKENQYMDLMYEAIKSALNNDGVVEPYLTLKELISGKKQDIVWLNWFESLNDKSLVSILKDILSKTLSLFMLKLKRTTILSTLHNKQPHDKKYIFLNRLFYKFLLKISDKIIILSRESKNYVEVFLGPKYLSKLEYIPHPAYIVSPKHHNSSNTSKFNVLYFGQLRPYKNIELILELAREKRNITFTIAGKPIDNQYALFLKNKSKDLSNINLILNHQSEEDLDYLISNSAIVILPYKKNSSLNSGVLFYAFSKGINVIIPAISSIYEFTNIDKIYHYNYDTENDHFINLQKILNKAEQDFNNDYLNFVNNTKILQRETIENNSLDKISKKIKLLIFGKCLNMPMPS